MSFILDALRKSEHERQRQTGPALVEVPVAAPRPRTNAWGTAAIVLLLVNLLVIGGLLLYRSGKAPPTAPAAPSAQDATVGQASAPPTPEPAAQASVTRTRPATSTPPMLRPAEPAPVETAGRNPLADEVPTQVPAMEYEAAARAAAPPAGPPAVSAAPRRGGSVVYETLPESYPVTSPNNPPPSATSNLPLADEIAARSGLPELRLELHVYSTRPQDRFVFINSRKYREGETTQEGATVKQITSDGVVLEAHGSRFLLPRD